ncbi:6-phosphofructokinase isozyme 1 [Acholeplasma oculi]|uniref:ATP-dependent 6-phosphofructokinase n=1 Tax=Acholeplasma oculi TaxID=35623 RepID=A0A061AAQ2_9MOLU|nr:6-phosphofructokinase [Acholeplasma oculi]CDR30474.1 6-Phosphofructokinase [Acholeplasma oculi]SKC48245.1 6-phosphofructokinase [Acholeplasma oculi]SUT89091.1 6-phosphofructokinase isozyme 1 [Acholeplasma oculi]
MKIAVLTSGGDAPGMNAAIRAVVRTGIAFGHEIFGVLDGYRGLLEDNFIPLTSKDVSGMLSAGGTMLGTARVTEFKEVPVQMVAIDNLTNRGIDALIVIGGDGSYRGALALHELGFQTIGIPGTIDNDVYGTDFTIGFHTALNTIVDAIDKLRDTSSSHRRCSIIEVMGRTSGDLALYAGICGGAEFIITPENPINKDKLISTLKKHNDEGRRHAIIVVTEQQFDVHKLAAEISIKSGFSSRATVLGYIQRGGRPVAEDRILASRMGSYAVEAIMQGVSGECIGIKNDKLVTSPLADIVNHPKERGELYDLVQKIR